MTAAILHYNLQLQYREIIINTFELNAGLIPKVFPILSISHCNKIIPTINVKSSIDKTGRYNL